MFFTEAMSMWVPPAMPDQWRIEYDQVPITSTSLELKTCGHCGVTHIGPCPRVKAIEYHENGSVKRVEYKD